MKGHKKERDVYLGTYDEVLRKVERNRNEWLHEQYLEED